MLGIFIEDKNTGEQFVLIQGSSNSYPDIKKVTITLESLKDDNKAIGKAKELYEQYTGNKYLKTADNTNSVLKQLTNQILDGNKIVKIFF